MGAEVGVGGGGARAAVVDQGCARDVPPPRPKFLHFHAVLRKNWSNSMLARSLENPGSATGAEKC